VVDSFAGLTGTLAEAVRDAARPARPALVGVDGPGCSGKSTLADALQTFLPGATVISLDDFFAPLNTQVLARISGEDLATGIPHLRWDAAQALVNDLASGGSASYTPYVWGADRLGSPVLVPRSDFILVEGLYALHPQLRSAYCFRIWVDCLAADRMARVADRMVRAGVSNRERWLDLWARLYVPREQAYLATFRPDLAADVFVTGAGLANGTRDSFAWTHSGRTPPNNGLQQTPSSLSLGRRS